MPNCLVESGGKVTDPNLVPDLRGYDIVWYYEGTDFKWEFLGYSVSEDITLTAELKVKKEMEIFEFTSTADTCIITGLKDAVHQLYVPGCVTEIGTAAFKGCIFEEITIAEGVEIIGANAFSSNTNLRTVNLPHSITKINKCIFNGCIPSSSSTTITINYNGTYAEWSNIIVADWNHYCYGFQEVVCTDKTVTYS